MNTKTDTIRCHECDERGFKAYMIPISYLWFCSSCWAVHPWNPKEILKTS